MTDEEITAEAEAVIRQLPGAVLRNTREAQGLTVGEVAGALKFSSRQIEALERDDFEQLQGKTFLRGFIRAYARMLKLEVEPLLAMLEVEPLPSQEQIIAPGNMGDTNPTPIYRRYGKKILLAAAIAIAAIGMVWYVEDQPAQLATAQTVVQPVAVALLAEQNQSLPPQPVSAVAVDFVSGTAAQAVTAPVLTFEFSDLSWLEVKDGSGQILLTGEFPGGKKQSVNGKPPYQLWIGKASAVKVTYRDQPLDLQPYVREEVARFTLDK